ncbi:MAG: DNA import protein CedA1 [Thermoprotei archaeon]
MVDVIGFIQNLIVNVTIIAWILFFLTWVIGWAIRGLPIPFMRVKRTGERLIEDAVWAAFWLAMGSTVFALIAYIASTFYQPLPEPPTL